MGWNEVQWVGVGWGWNELEWVGMGWIGLD